MRGIDMARRGLALAAMAIVAATGARATTAADLAQGQKLLADARAACGGAAWDAVAGWHERGRIAVAGHPAGPYEAWAAIGRLAFALRTAPGGMPVGHAGIDGALAWRLRPDGTVDFGAGSGPARLHPRDAYLSNFGYFLPQRYPAVAVAGDPRTVGGVIYDVVTVRPAGIEDFDLWLDRTSHRVARIVVGAHVAELRDYRTVAGVCAPTVAIQTDGDPAHTTRIDTDSVDTAALPPAVFAPPPR